MKKLLFVLLAFISFGNVLHAAVENNPVEIVFQQVNNNDDDEIERPFDKGGNGGPIRRSIQRQIAYAYIYNKVISIDFNVTIEVATVTITNATTGETVCTEISSNPVNLNIDLNGEDNGDYIIEIEADGILLTGYFSL